MAGATFAIGSLAISGLGAMGTGILALGAAIGPVGWAIVFAALVGGLINLAFQMESKDWKALFDNVGSALGSLYEKGKGLLGLHPSGTRQPGFMVPDPTGFEAGGRPDPMLQEIPAVPVPAGPRPLGPLEQVAPPASWNPPDPRRSSYIPIGASRRRAETTINTAVYLDGRQIAEVISKHQGNNLVAPPQPPIVSILGEELGLRKTLPASADFAFLCCYTA